MFPEKNLLDRQLYWSLKSMASVSIQRKSERKNRLEWEIRGTKERKKEEAEKEFSIHGNKMVPSSTMHKTRAYNLLISTQTCPRPVASFETCNANLAQSYKTGESLSTGFNAQSRRGSALLQKPKLTCNCLLSLCFCLSLTILCKILYLFGRRAQTSDLLFW